MAWHKTEIVLSRAFDTIKNKIFYHYAMVPNGTKTYWSSYFGDIDMAINSNDQIKELEEQFQHYNIDNHEKDRLI